MSTTTDIVDTLDPTESQLIWYAKGMIGRRPFDRSNTLRDVKTIIAAGLGEQGPDWIKDDDVLVWVGRTATDTGAWRENVYGQLMEQIILGSHCPVSWEGDMDPDKTTAFERYITVMLAQLHVLKMRENGVDLFVIDPPNPDIFPDDPTKQPPE